MSWQRTIRFRYTLRALLVFITLFALWGGYHANRGWREQRAAEVLRACGAVLQFGPTCNARQGLVSDLAFAYDGLVHSLWREGFVESVEITSNLDPQIVGAIKALPHLRRLGLTAPTTVNGDLLHLPELTRGRIDVADGAIKRILAGHRLYSLSIAGFRLRELDWEIIGGQAWLEEVRLVECNPSEAALVKVATLPRLRALSVTDCYVTGEKLATAAGSPSLAFVYCDDVPLGVEFASFIRRCPNTRWLELRESSINDAFIASLGPHRGLEMLSLQGTGITDESIPSLKRLPAMKSVSLPSTITREGRADLEKACPELSIIGIQLSPSSGRFYFH